MGFPKPKPNHPTIPQWRTRFHPLHNGFKNYFSRFKEWDKSKTSKLHPTRQTNYAASIRSLNTKKSIEVCGYQKQDRPKRPKAGICKLSWFAMAMFAKRLLEKAMHHAQVLCYPLYFLDAVYGCRSKMSVLSPWRIHFVPLWLWIVLQVRASVWKFCVSSLSYWCDWIISSLNAQFKCFL